MYYSQGVYVASVVVVYFVYAVVADVYVDVFCIVYVVVVRVYL